MKKDKPSYKEYLHLDKILNSQHLKSSILDKPIHDEMLFIIVHQAYELWFKQIIHELNSVINYFEDDCVNETNINTVVLRLERVNNIQNLIVNQIKILESMTPMDFLEFRDLLNPASGFQSTQFRIIENILGLKRDKRLKFSKEDYTKFLSKEDKTLVEKIENGTTLFDEVQLWLERTPFLKDDEFDFWEAYKKSVTKMLDNDIKLIKENSYLSESGKNEQISNYEDIYNNYKILFNKEKYSEIQDSGAIKISQKACLAALFIMLYRHEPILHGPYRLLTKLIDIDHSLNSWRYSHALLAKRMIGSKIGSGGSSGYSYLRKTMEKHNVFNDFANLSTYLIPKSALPKLPKKLKNKLGYYFNNEDN